MENIEIQTVRHNLCHTNHNTYIVTPTQHRTQEVEHWHVKVLLAQNTPESMDKPIATTGLQKCEPGDFTGFEPPASPAPHFASAVVSKWRMRRGADQNQSGHVAASVAMK